MKNRDWKKWAAAAGVRAIKTVMQTAVAIIGTAVNSRIVGITRWQTESSQRVRN